MAKRSAGLVVAVIDGLGHGVEAAAAAEIAIHTITASLEEEPTALLHACHGELRPTRGVVAGIACIDSANCTLQWAGVGNVIGILIHTYDSDGMPTRSRPARRETMISAPGILGYNLPNIRASRFPIQPHDVLLFATDGINPQFDENLPLLASPQEIAEHIVSRPHRGTDDSLICVGRFRGRTL